ncbi:hypothetical protein [Arthrobacter sp. B0490]|uniref:hypothetical protein n=1 Tax=Arthrobacter sp. B0490 TaxID=2058891 RepID=UPI000CE408F9|nr:hypothetical protein [Arthrobacter sp. B0490]
MTAPPQNIPGAGTSTASETAPLRFPPHSRYANVEIRSIVEEDGTRTQYLARRFITDEIPRIIAERRVTDGDRADLLADQYYGDPLLAWRIADANDAEDPDQLTSIPGAVIVIPAAEGGAP